MIDYKSWGQESNKLDNITTTDKMTAISFSLLCVVLVSSCWGEQELSTFCGSCYCSSSKELAVCDGKQLPQPPPIPVEIRHQLKTLGLQRNSIDFVSEEYIDQLPNLKRLDVSQQVAGCVYLEWSVQERDLIVYGKF